ncbi:nucleotidyltransferase domain-containing protein [Viridibacillus arvi]|uniref:nucleotidyltransferase domain-containing protein n=1 Tax=Viridibacillus arvi TaxID=263475 RepID=UPI0034CE995E
MIELKPINKQIDEKEILNLLNLKGNELVFLSGSLIQGIGNRFSDIDIFVVVEDFEELKKDETIVYNHDDIKTTFSSILGIGCDIEYWPLSTVKEIFNQINNLDKSDIDSPTLTQLDIKGYSLNSLTSFVHRFLVGKPIHNANIYDELKASTNLDKFYQFMTRYYINLVDGFYNDATGNLDKGEYETALYLARDILIKTISAYVFSQNVTLDREKWAYLNLKNISKENKEAARILQKVDKVLFYKNLETAEDLKENAEQIIILINNIINIISKEHGGY